jgi:hypothetical protein
MQTIIFNYNFILAKKAYESTQALIIDFVLFNFVKTNGKK